MIAVFAIILQYDKSNHYPFWINNVIDIYTMHLQQNLNFTHTYPQKMWVLFLIKKLIAN